MSDWNCINRFVVGHAAIGAKHVEFDPGIVLHGIHNFAGLERGGFQDGASNVALVDVAGQPGDDAPSRAFQ